MSGRRHHSRATFVDAGGLLRIAHDVVVMRASRGHFFAVSPRPAAVGDVLTVDVVTERGRETAPVRVVASRPIVVEGLARHELQLERVEAMELDDPAGPGWRWTDDR